MTDAEIRLHHEITMFLNREARLLEQSRFDEWLQLFTPDVRYWVAPLRETIQGREEPLLDENTLSFGLFDEDFALLQMRVDRLKTGLAFAETPESITQRFITNIDVEPGEIEHEVVAYSKFIVFQTRSGREDWLIGQRQDKLRNVDGGWKIAKRNCVLAQQLLTKTISVFL